VPKLYCPGGYQYLQMNGVNLVTESSFLSRVSDKVTYVRRKVDSVRVSCTSKATLTRHCWLCVGRV
jgi:hypothetical protein